MLSYGGISQQFSIPEHIEMSMFTAEFLRHSGEHLRILGKITILIFVVSSQSIMEMQNLVFVKRISFIIR